MKRVRSVSALFARNKGPQKGQALEPLRSGTGSVSRPNLARLKAEDVLVSQNCPRRSLVMRSEGLDQYSCAQKRMVIPSTLQKEKAFPLSPQGMREEDQKKKEYI